MRDSYRFYIQRELDERVRKNSSYSASAFARDLDFTAQQLGQILKGKNGLSTHAADKISKILKLSSVEREHFIALVQTHHARSPKMRAAAAAKLSLINSKMTTAAISDGAFNELSTWTDWAAHLLTEVANFVPDYDWIGNRLGISKEAAEAVMSRLVDAGFLVRSGRTWIPSAVKFSFSPNITSKSIRAFHSAVCRRAEATIESEPVSARYFHTLMLTVSKDQRAEIVRRIDAFMDELAEDYSDKRDDVDRVYAVSLQLFPLDHVDAPAFEKQTQELN